MKAETYGGYFGPLKVYGWIDNTNSDLQRAFPEWAEGHEHIRQARVCVAAKSAAEAARLAGAKRPSALFNFCETGNVIEAGVALNEPGVIFWRPIDGVNLPYRKREAR